MTYSMTDEQRFIFDLKGWLLIPSVLQPDELREIKEFLDTLQFNPESLPERDRHVCGGACSQLLDHPTVVGVLNEIIASRWILAVQTWLQSQRLTGSAAMPGISRDEHTIQIAAHRIRRHRRRIMVQ